MIIMHTFTVINDLIKVKILYNSPGLKLDLNKI